MYAKLFRRVTRIVLAALAVVVVCVACVFAVTSLEQMNRSMTSTTEAYSRQIASGMDAVLDQSIYQTYRFILDDNGITATVDRARENRSELLSLVNIMNAALVSDQYYESLLLYTRQDNQVLLVTDATKSFLPIEDVGDGPMIDMLQRGMAASLPPMLVTRASDVQRVIMPVAVPLGLNGLSRTGDCLLVTNIDVGRIFKTLLSEVDIARSADVYITDSSGTVLIAADYSMIGRNVADLGYDRYSTSILGSLWAGGPVCYRAVSAVNRKGWQVRTFLLETGALGRWFNLSGTLLVILLIAAAVFGVVWWQLRRSMKPVSELAQKSCRQDMKEFMLQPGLPGEPAFPLSHHHYMLILVRHAQQSAQRVASLLENDAAWTRDTERHVIAMNKITTIVAIAIEDEAARASWLAWAVRRRPLLEETAGEPVYMVVGSARAAGFPLSAAYQETLLLVGYTMHLNGRRVISRLDLPNLGTDFEEYSVDLEKQMINNLFAGSGETFDALLGQFVQRLFDEQECLPNMEILQRLERWQNAVLAQAARIPLRLPADLCASFDENDTQATVLQKLSAFAHTTGQFIRQHEEDRKANLGAEVKDFIDQRLTDPEFSFSTVSDHFGLSRSQLTAILKEQLGMGFADYVSGQRIERGKQLLRDPAFTVSDVALKVGFTYAHYFIRVFKKREGVTPGQYRERLAEEDNIIYLSQKP
ncbi:MAG: AraC family transcriptional regulator [Clostridia bacterium]|nr:AraC family transcriptional regulator [Clostridia bacterium]